LTEAIGNGSFTIKLTAMSTTLETPTTALLKIDIVNTQDRADAPLRREYDLQIQSTKHPDEFAFVGEYLHNDYVSFLFLANSDRQKGVRRPESDGEVSFPVENANIHHRYCLVKTTYKQGDMPDEWSLTLIGKDGNKVTFTRARV
jgi:hypothetical protein